MSRLLVQVQQGPLMEKTTMFELWEEATFLINHQVSNEVRYLVWRSVWNDVWDEVYANIVVMIWTENKR